MPGFAKKVWENRTSIWSITDKSLSPVSNIGNPRVTGLPGTSGFHLSLCLWRCKHARETDFAKVVSPSLRENKNDAASTHLSWNSSTLATSCKELTHWKRLWCWEGLGAGGEGDDRGWDGWMASRTHWTWVWVNSGSWWWTGRPGVLRFMGSQRVGHDWVTELNWTLIFRLPALEHLVLKLMDFYGLLPKSVYNVRKDWKRTKGRSGWLRLIRELNVIRGVGTLQVKNINSVLSFHSKAIFQMYKISSELLVTILFTVMSISMASNGVIF